MSPFGFYFDPLYFVFALPGLILAIYAQSRVQGAYNRYRQVRNARNLTGVQVAEYLLRQNGLSGAVNISGTPGDLTDHYDPRDRTLYLSASVARQPSVAALGIVAHEIGHAVQHAENYGPLAFRSAIVPAVNIGTNLGYILFFIGFFFNLFGLALAGVIAFSASVVFSLATLPVEFNASARAGPDARSVRAGRSGRSGFREERAGRGGVDLRCGSGGCAAHAALLRPAPLWRTAARLIKCARTC
jgi:Zn-dependent membrane protease YugP